MLYMSWPPRLPEPFLLRSRQGPSVRAFVRWCQCRSGQWERAPTLRAGDNDASCGRRCFTRFLCATSRIKQAPDRAGNAIVPPSRAQPGLLRFWRTNRLRAVGSSRLQDRGTSYTRCRRTRLAPRARRRSSACFRGTPCRYPTRDRGLPSPPTPSYRSPCTS